MCLLQDSLFIEGIFLIEFHIHPKTAANVYMYMYMYFLN